MTDIENRAFEMSKNFLETEKQYRLGFVEAEMSNPKTKNPGECFAEDTAKGLDILWKADNDLCKLFENTLYSRDFDLFAKDVLCALQKGGRIIISGCGSTGRLAMRIEASFRIAIKKAAENKGELLKLEDKVVALMTGGDYAIIRAVESFEDYIELGMMQAKELGLTDKDVLVGVTATGETTSILGTAKQALDDGAKVWMVVCTKPESILGKLKRADDVYTNEKCRSLYMNCGGMAVTGSTRMQSSTIEQAVISAALETALDKLVDDGWVTDKKYLCEGFEKCVGLLKDEQTAKAMALQVDKEKELYEKGGHVTYFADEYLLDILADTTERGPTFSVPPFRPQSRKDLTLSLAFVKNPLVDTKSAWKNCFERIPRCVDKTTEEYSEIGIKEEDIKRIPKINLDALYEYRIGNEKDEEREDGNSLATWIGFDDTVPQDFYKAAENYGERNVLIVNKKNKQMHKTRMKMFEHLAFKLFVNSFSTGTMAKMGRILGNYMVYINISNKKLIDRATRIVSDLCNITYDEANYQLFLTKLILEEQKIDGKAAIETINRLNGKK